MAYTKTNWVNEGPPALDADHLNHIEQGIYNLAAQLDAVLADLALIGKTLWTGSWASGSNTIPDADKYRAFIVINSNIPMIAVRGGGNLIYGFNTACSSNQTQYVKVVRFDVDANDPTKWTLVYANQLNHVYSSNHSAGTTFNVEKIIGLIPNVWE